MLPLRQNYAHVGIGGSGGGGEAEEQQGRGIYSPPLSVSSSPVFTSRLPVQKVWPLSLVFPDLCCFGDVRENVEEEKRKNCKP